MENPKKGYGGVVSNATIGSSSATSRLRDPVELCDALFPLLFVDVCQEEIIPVDNRLDTEYFATQKSLVRKYYENTGRYYVYEKLQNYCDALQKDWILFKKLIHKETGLSWTADDINRIYELHASNEWWERKLKENGDYVKFRNQNLALILMEHDKLFSDIAAMGKIEREYSGESTKGKKNVSILTSEKEVQCPLNKAPEEISIPSTEITIGDAIKILNDVPGMAPMTELWNYASNLLTEKNMRQVFVCQPSHESRLSWLEFNYDIFKRS